MPDIQNAAHMADGYSRVTGRTGVCVAQNGPGITNFVTGVAAAFWANSPMVVVTPEAGTNTAGLGGFQEAQQLPIFETITKEQVGKRTSFGYKRVGPRLRGKQTKETRPCFRFTLPTRRAWRS